MRRVLVVDDDKMNLRRTRLILEKYYDILTAESGQEALDIIPDSSGYRDAGHERNRDVPAHEGAGAGHPGDISDGIRP